MARHIELIIQVTDALQKEILVAQLTAAGANGFEETRSTLNAFIAEDDYDEASVKEIIEKNYLKYSVSVIEDINWNAEWESGFEPVTIDNFCAIRAAFHEPNTTVSHDIVITPKMSFGTGHHATTHMMAKAMQGLDFSGKTVFDFGTGTGVLAILAEKCGAKRITAIDNDEWSISNAAENFNGNNCHNILLSNSKEIIGEDVYDVILANINRNIILENLAAIKQHLASGGVVLLSGLLTGDEPIILEEASRQQLALVQRFEMSGWICLLMVMG